VRVTVTGASGFLGAWVVRALADAGHTTTAVVRSADPWRLRGVDGVAVVAGPTEEWPQLAATSRPEVLMLLDWAGVDAQSRQNDEVQRSNLDRWTAVTDAAVQTGASRIVGLGSQAEFGPRRDIILDDSPVAPVSAYGRVKAEAAEWLASLSRRDGVSTVWARVFSAYGPLDNEGVLLAQIADASARGDAVALSSARQAWSYLYASDAAAALAVLAGHPDAPLSCNVAHPESPVLRDIIDAFTNTLVNARPQYGAVPDAPSKVQLRASTARLSSLGWSPAVSLHVGLAATSAWLRRQPVPDPLGTGTLPARPLQS